MTIPTHDHNPKKPSGESDLTNYKGELPDVVPKKFVQIEPLSNEEFKKITDAVDAELGPIAIDTKIGMEVMGEMLGHEPIIAEAKKNAIKRKRTPKVEDFAPPALPIEPEALPVETVNGNTLVDKILKATTDGKLTHTDVTAIVRKHGLNAVRDIFTNAHLIPAINAEIDEVLKC
jgi:hypothetical protein